MLRGVLAMAHSHSSIRTPRFVCLRDAESWCNDPDVSWTYRTFSYARSNVNLPCCLYHSLRFGHKSIKNSAPSNPSGPRSHSSLTAIDRELGSIRVLRTMILPSAYMVLGHAECVVMRHQAEWSALLIPGVHRRGRSSRACK